MRTSASLLSCLIGTLLCAQVTLHHNAAEYRANTGEDLGQYVDVVIAMGRYVLVVRKDGVERRLPCKDLWGFTYKGVLFRFSSEGHVPVRLMKEGAMCYFENGFAHLRMVHDGTEVAHATQGHRSYLSRDLDGPIVPAVFKEGDGRSASGRYRAQYPAFEALFTCIGDQDDLEHNRQCVVDFEVALEGGR
ncbi:MAG: hypothetical protein JNM31_02745 [Flavobacteriales bacterium]|nr:hypothetical protein [Flavobacteriales bacterium]